MKSSGLRAYTITSLLVAVLVLNVLRQSDIGGPGTIYNTISFLLVVGVLLLYPRFHPYFVFAFAAPVLFLMLSVVVNGSTLPMNGFRTALAIAAGYSLLMLRPLPLNITLLRRSVTVYLIGGLVLSLYFFVTSLPFSVGEANHNFNVNPNSASLVFFGSVVLSLVFARGALKYFLVVAFSLLLLTTASRTGLVAGGLLLAGYGLFSTEVTRRSVWRNPLSGRRIPWLVLTPVVIPALALLFIPGSIEFLEAKLARVDLEFINLTGIGREEIWKRGWDVSQQSLLSIGLGHGPGTATEVIGGGPHSSYVDAFTSVGWPFMLSTLIGLFLLCRYHVRRSQKDFVIYTIAILAYGTAETILFNGIGTIWYILILLSLYYRSMGSVTSPRRIGYVESYR